MCRLLSFVCAPAVAARVAADVLPAFTALSCEHKDGWGMAWHDTDGLHTVREPQAAHTSTRYADVVSTVTTSAALLHLRLASPGLAVAEENSHPFLRDGCAFGHNGFVGPIGDLDKFHAPDLVAAGSTDSEKYFLSVLTRMRDGEPAHLALLSTALDLLDLAETSSANASLLTADALHMVCAYRPGSQPPGRLEDYFTLRYRAEASAVIVGSDGVARDDWQRLPNRSVLSVDRVSRRCVVTSGR